MAEHTVAIDVIDISIPKDNHRNIAIINQPNPCYGYNANAKEVWQLIQISRYYVYEAGTKNIISGDNYYDYFPEEGGGGGGGGVTPEEVRTIVSDMTDSEVSDASTNPIQNRTIKEYVDSTKVTVDSAIDENSTNAIQNGVITKFVNSSIETSTATFRGTYTTIEALNAAAGDKNDYAFYSHTDAAGNTVFDRYKFVPTEQADLPEGYTQLEYIESSGTQYIDTGVPPTDKRRIYIKFNPLNYVYAVAFFGLDGFSSRLYHDPFMLRTDNLDGKFTVDGIDTTIHLNFPGVNEFEYNYPSITVNGDVSSIADPGTWDYPTGSNIYLFAQRYDTQAKASLHSSMRLYACKIYDIDGVTLIRDFIPCKNASNAIGLYDLVNSTFYPNNGSGAFAAGPQANGYWEYEYSLNNSSYTAEQWAAINSGIKSTDVAQIGTNTSDISNLKTEKVDKETGKGLSTNDYTTAEKTKLENLADIQSIGDGLSLDNGELSATGEELVKTKIVNSINTASPSSSEPKGTVLNLWTIDPANEMLILNKVAFENSIKETGVYAPDTWNTTTWNITRLSASYIWTDGDNIYYSNDSNHFVLDKATSTWNKKKWNGKTSFYGSYIWTDGDNIYYSIGSEQYVLDKNTSTWSTKTWNGLTSFRSDRTWTDGDNIYYSYESDQYVLDKSTSTWNVKTWSGLTSFYGGNNIWTDGENIYYSNGSNQYVLDKSTSTWSTKTWNGLTDFSGLNIWTDGENIYHSNGSNQYILDKYTSTWNAKTWSGLTSFNGHRIWTDGNNIYYSDGSDQYVLK